MSRAGTPAVGLAVHLYASDGRWIAWYQPGLPYVWDTGGRWIGWFPWADAADSVERGDVLDPHDAYLGTVVGDRLLARTARRPRPVPRRVPEPQRPVGPPDVDRALALPPPIGYVDIDAGRLSGD
ncbi:hypothetical protein ACQPX6_23955 [Actinomycetospora sp. CA-101289]|uniref:hypothetical protein n=1 Tax=Actinomycetospora sp. CA-101289 TaxID=3239893 RepID=UPI003D99C230